MKQQVELLQQENRLLKARLESTETENKQLKEKVESLDKENTQVKEHMNKEVEDARTKSQSQMNEQKELIAKIAAILISEDRKNLLAKMDQITQQLRTELSTDTTAILSQLQANLS